MDNVESVILELRKSIESQNFKGHDPYDCLKIQYFNNFYSKSLRIFLTTLFRFSPLNFRIIFRTPKSYNPKALSLLLSSYINLHNLNLLNSDKTIKILLYQLLTHRSRGYSGFCCGYDFPWQNRERLLPAFTPTLVNTVYAAHSLFDYFELTGDKRLRDIALSSCDYVLNDLNRTKVKKGISFSYSPYETNIVHNANALAASLFSRSYSYTRDTSYRKFAISLMEYLISEQKTDGRWNYSVNMENKTEKVQIDWHQGFILQSLNQSIEYLDLGESKYQKSLIKGLKFYKRQFTKDGKGYWRLPQLYPINIHNQAQGVITFSILSSYMDESEKIADRVLSWTIDNLRSPKGFFYYQRGLLFKNKINYIRWNQAWMLYALTTYYKQRQINNETIS